MNKTKKLIFCILAAVGLSIAFYLKAQESVGPNGPFVQGTRGVTILIPYNGDPNSYLNGQGQFTVVSSSATNGNNFITIITTNITINSNLVFNVGKGGKLTIDVVTNNTFVNTNTFIVTSNAFFNNTYITNEFSQITTNNTFVNTNTFIVTSNAFINNTYITNEFTQITTNNTFVNTNVFIATSNTFLNNTYITNLTNNTFISQNSYISNAFITNLTVQNFFAAGGFFTTNAFPSVTNSFDFTNSFQFLLTYTPCSITNVTSVSNNYVNTGMLLITNQSSSNVTLTITIPGATPIGAQSTSSLTIPSQQGAWVRLLAYGNVFTNYADDTYPSLLITAANATNECLLIGLGATNQATVVSNGVVAHTVQIQGTATHITSSTATAQQLAVNPSTTLDVGSDVPLLDAANQFIKTNSFDSINITNRILFKVATWSGPTNNYDLAISRQQYTTTTALSITGFVNTASAGFELGSILTVTNSGGSDVILYLPSGTSSDDGGRNYTVTNKSARVFSFRHCDTGTNCVSRQMF